MIVQVGSTSRVKLRAVRRAFSMFFPRVRVVAASVSSGVSEKPSSMAELVRGARNRALQARGGDYAVGIEAGFFRLAGRPHLLTMACVSDGRRSCLGGSPFFEFDPSWTAADATGIVGTLTRRRVTREEVTRWAVVMALAPFVAGARRARSTRT